MPVVVTGADTALGRAVAVALAPQGVDVRATVSERGAVRELVDRGVKTAVWNVGDDSERLGAVLEGAHTVVNLYGGAAGALAAVPDLLDAAEDSSVARIVTLAPLAPPTGPEQAAIDALRASAYDVVVLRVAAVTVGGEVVATRPEPAYVAPIRFEDLVAAVLAADRLRELSGFHEVDAVGPEPAALVRPSAANPLQRLGSRLRRSAPPDRSGDGGAALTGLLGVRPRGAHSDDARSDRSR